MSTISTRLPLHISDSTILTTSLTLYHTHMTTILSTTHTITNTSIPPDSPYLSATVNYTTTIATINPMSVNPTMLPLPKVIYTNISTKDIISITHHKRVHLSHTNMSPIANTITHQNYSTMIQLQPPYQ